MNLAPIAVTVVSGGTRLQGWRGTLREGGTTTWRCDCRLPHARPELASACGDETLSKRGSGFYPGGYDMDDWMPVPQTDEERQALIEAIQSLPAASVDDDLHTLTVLRTQMLGAEDYAQIRRLQGAAEAVRKMWLANEEVRKQYEHTHLTGEWRIGRAMLLEEQEVGSAPGGQPYQEQNATRFPGERVATLAEKVGNRTYGWRMKTIAPLPVEGFNSLVKDAQARFKEATLTGLVKILKTQEAAMRRLDSITAPRIENGKDYRVGDCRLVLSDIEDDSVPLILTDPPYEDGARPLWQWLADFAHRVLIPGGSLICYFGHTRINELYRIFDDAELMHWWSCVMLHDQNAQRLAGKFVIVGHKPILWYVKDFRRGRSLVPDTVYSTRRNKSEHAWGQGQGGVSQWIHQLTDPGEMIVDPFAGTGEWGDISCEAGRRWIGADLVMRGTTSVTSRDLEDAAD